MRVLKLLYLVLTLRGRLVVACSVAIESDVGNMSRRTRKSCYPESWSVCTAAGRIGDVDQVKSRLIEDWEHFLPPGVHR